MMAKWGEYDVTENYMNCLENEVLSSDEYRETQVGRACNQNEGAWNVKTNYEL
jgi:hypothetical protein